MLQVIPSVIPALVFIRLVDRLEEWGSRAETEIVFLIMMLLACEKVMNFVMKDKCIDVDSTSLKHSIKSLDKACSLISTTGSIGRFSTSNSFQSLVS